VTVRFLADADLRVEIIEGLHSREPAVDILDVKTSGLRGTADPALLEIAAGPNLDRSRPANDDTALSRASRCREASSGDVHRSAAAERHRRSHRIALSRVDGLASRRMAESDRVLAFPVNGRGQS
jgi:hypothetical protein